MHMLGDPSRSLVGQLKVVQSALLKTHGMLKSYSAIQMISKQMINKPPGTRQN